MATNPRLTHATGDRRQCEQPQSNTVKAKEGSKWVLVVFITKIRVFRKRSLVRTNLDETIFAVDPSGWYRTSVSDVPFHNVRTLCGNPGDSRENSSLILEKLQSMDAYTNKTNKQRKFNRLLLTHTKPFNRTAQKPGV